MEPRARAAGAAAHGWARRRERRVNRPARPGRTPRGVRAGQPERAGGGDRPFASRRSRGVDG